MSVFSKEIISYKEFCISIRRKDSSSYSLSVIDSPAGVTQDYLEFTPPSGLEIEAGLTSAIRNPWVKRSGIGDALDPVKDIGKQLFAAIFRSPVQRLFEESLTMANMQGDGIRIRILMEESELTTIPWEFLYDEYRQDFFALSTLTPVVRQRTVSHILKPVPVEPPLRVLVVASDLEGYSEKSGIELDSDLLKKLQEKSSNLELTILEYASREQFIDAIAQDSYDIVHFSGTAVTNLPWAEGPQVLGFVKEAGKPWEKKKILPEQIVDASSLKKVLGDVQKLRIFCLNDCATDWFASELSGVVPAVVGMQGNISKKSRVSFAEGFYQAVLTGQPLETAMTEGRKMINYDDPGGREWGLPVLYLTIANGKLFSLLDKKTSSTSEASIVDDLSSAPEDPKLQREWEYYRMLLRIKQENLAAIQEQTSTFSAANEIPLTLKTQIDTINNEIIDLKTKLKEISE